MKNMTSILVGVLLAGTLASAQEAKITVRVVDESGDPVTNAIVHAGFATAIKPGWGWGAGKPNRVEGVTDTNGVCTLQGDGNGGSVGVAVFKDGYYGSSGYLVVFSSLTGTIKREWQPWNPTVEVGLKPIGTPIPMYAKKLLYVTIPAVNTPVEYDLMKGDWLPPHGKGKEGDIVLRLDLKPPTVITNRYGPVTLSDDTLTVSFPGDGNGVSSVVLPAHGGQSALCLSGPAPENGYVSNIVKRVVQNGSGLQSNIQDDQNYFIRVRTVKDEDGNIVSALYGKIYGDFRFEAHVKEISFTYYLNPAPNERDVEFDPRKNLFKNLTSQEEVREP